MLIDSGKILKDFFARKEHRNEWKTGVQAFENRNSRTPNNRFLDIRKSESKYNNINYIELRKNDFRKGKIIQISFIRLRIIM